MAGYIPRRFTCPQAVTHPSSNRASELTLQQLSTRIDVKAVVLKLPCQVEKADSNAAYLCEQHPHKISYRSDLKRRRLRLFREMTSRPPSWKYDVISQIWLHQLTRIINLRNNPANYIPFRFETSDPRAFLKRSTQQEQEVTGDQFLI